LPTDPEARGGDFDVRAAPAQAGDESVVAVLPSGVDLEGAFAENAEVLFQLALHLLAPPQALIRPGPFQGRIVWSQDLFRIDKSMEGRQYEPALACGLDVTSPTPEERRRVVEVLRRARAVSLLLDAADKPDATSYTNGVGHVITVLPDRARTGSAANRSIHIWSTVPR
jgi:hypothetical protein